MVGENVNEEMSLEEALATDMSIIAPVSLRIVLCFSELLFVF